MVDKLPHDFIYVSSVVDSKIININGGCMGFVVINKDGLDMPVIYKVKLPKKGFMDRIYYVTERQSPLLGFDDKGFNEIKIPIDKIERITLYYRNNDQNEWRMINLNENRFDLQLSEIADKNKVEYIFNRLCHEYTSCE